MCLAIPGQVVRFEDDEHHFATVEVSGLRRQVNVALIVEDGLEVGDWVLIHVGFALSRISPAEAQATLDTLAALGEAEAAIEEVEGYRFGTQGSAADA